MTKIPLLEKERMRKKKLFWGQKLSRHLYEYLQRQHFLKSFLGGYSSFDNSKFHIHGTWETPRILIL